MTLLQGMMLAPILLLFGFVFLIILSLPLILLCNFILYKMTGSDTKHIHPLFAIVIAFIALVIILAHVVSFKEPWFN
jgi:hypothetical protein